MTVKYVHKVAHRTEAEYQNLSAFVVPGNDRYWRTERPWNLNGDLWLLTHDTHVWRGFSIYIMEKGYSVRGVQQPTDYPHMTAKEICSVKRLNMSDSVRVTTAEINLFGQKTATHYIVGADGYVSDILQAEIPKRGNKVGFIQNLPVPKRAQLIVTHGGDVKLKPVGG